MAFHFCLCLLFTSLSLSLGLPRWPHSDCAGNTGNAGSIPGFGRFPRVEHGNPIQDSCLGNPMERGAWQAVVQRVAKSRTRLNMHTHCLHNAYSDDQLIKCPLLLVSLTPLSLSPNCFPCWSTCMKIAVSAFQGFRKLGQDDRWMGWSKWSWESELRHWFEWRSREICTKEEVIRHSD